MAKRKPPSQRSERQMDDTARAIARLREEAKPEKSAESGDQANDNSKPRLAHQGKGPSLRKASGPAVSPSTKRPKKIGV